ncbi:purine-cytosine permease family protein [Arthrobacter sp. NPDC090010]|uniref:purine-cytosine permease family protein n=1 Tax=Arthrobacter sp. NPDC090010 TaxID=3363942 RepID=UPI003813B09E
MSTSVQGLYARLDARLAAEADSSGPVKGTLSGPRIGMIWLAANLVVTTLLTGTLFVTAIPFSTAVVMIVAGTLVGALALTSIGAIGTRTGLPTMAITRGAFGLKGSLLPVGANVVVLMGWSWVQAMLAGVTVDHVVQQFTGFSSPVLFSVLCQLLVVILAIFGHTGIARVEPWLAVVILAVIAWIFAMAFGRFSPADFSGIAVDTSLGSTPAIVLDVVIATAVSWTVLSADINRMARSTRAGVVGAGVGYSVSTIVAMLLGATALGYVVLSGGDAVSFDPATIVDSFGVPLALVIFFSVMATNTMVVYGMTTSVVNARPGGRTRFLPAALILGALSILGSTWLSLLGQFTSFLTLIGSLFVPVFAVVIVDYYWFKRASYGKDLLLSTGGRFWYIRGVNWIAVACWAIGAGTSVLLSTVWTSPIGATLPTFALSAALYWLGMNLRPSTQRSS